MILREGKCREDHTKTSLIHISVLKGLYRRVFIGINIERDSPLSAISGRSSDTSKRLVNIESGCFDVNCDV